MGFENHSGRTLLVYALAIDFVVVIVAVVLLALGAWLINEWVMA